MRACLADVKRFAIHDGPGIRTTLFLKGCTLSCLWCHNPESISKSAQLAYYEHKCINCKECVKVCPTNAQYVDNEKHFFDRQKCIGCGKCERVCLGDALRFFGREIDVCQAVDIVLKDRSFYGFKGGVTISGGEPLMQAAFCAELLKELKKEGIHTAIDTAGNVNCSAFESVLPYTDIFLYDVKHMDSAAHKKLTGSTNKLLLENLIELSKRGALIEIRIPLIAGLNNSKENLNATGDFLSKLNINKVVVLPYHSMAKSKYFAFGLKYALPNIQPPTAEEIKKSVDILCKYGINATS